VRRNSLSLAPQGSETVRSEDRDGSHLARVIDGSGWMLSRAVAELLGVQTATLNKWRARGKGPKVWCRTSPTTIHYLRSSVLEFEREWRETAVA
jgi:hypothetical protein